MRVGRPCRSMDAGISPLVNRSSSDGGEAHVMRPVIRGFVALVALAACSIARAGLGPNGLGPNGLGPNGLGPNGLGPNGLGPNGLGPNGLGANGLGPNGLGPNGLGPNGLPYTFYVVQPSGQTQSDFKAWFEADAT